MFFNIEQLFFNNYAFQHRTVLFQPMTMAVFNIEELYYATYKNYVFNI